MSDSSKRLDLRFGAFACSVQGFEDPVQPVQQVLRALQTMLEETPDLAGAGIAFDAEAIEQLAQEVARRADLAESNVEITPGLIIVHHGDGRSQAAAESEPAEDESWDRPVLRSDRLRSGSLRASAPQDDAAFDAPDEAPSSEGAAEGYVNIFAPRAAAHTNGRSMFSGDAGEADGYPDAAAETGPAAGDDDPLEARLGRLAEEVGLSRDILRAGGDYSEGEAPGSGLNIFTSGGDSDDHSESLNLFSDPTESDTRESGGDAYDAGPGRSGDTALTRFDLRSRLADPMSPPPEEPEPEPEEVPEVAAAEPYTAEKLAKAAHAKTVEDLIVCSAAWMVLMRGQTKFGRRDVLEVFDKLPGDHPTTLEAKIKGFGKAVRNGHLIAITDGVFGISRSDLEDFQRLL